jgi:hypothetical protein
MEDAEMNEQVIEAQRAVWEALTPQELAVEYTRVCSGPPLVAEAKGDMIQRMLSTLRERRSPSPFDFVR